MAANPIAISPSPNETDPDLHLIVLGNPENRRVHLFADAVARAGYAGLEVVSWMDFLADASVLTSRYRPGGILRIESPGENFEVERALLSLGSDGMIGDRHACMSRDEIVRLEFERGRILPMRQWYQGWQVALGRVEASLHAVPDCKVMNPPAEIAAMFDKARCHELFRERGVAVPPLLGIPGSFEDLRAMMRAQDCRRVFLKPCHSSSSSGVVAFETSALSEQAFSSVELVRYQDGLKLYNSLNVRRYTDAGEISELIDAICRERSIAEVWLPKAGLDGRRLDLRVLVVAGKAAHAVVRQSRGPMTNLHLGNQRGDLLRLRERMGEASWRAAMIACERAAAAFPASLYAAVDLLVAPSYRKFAVAEINAFGDLLPNLLHDGHDAYAAELAALSLRHARPPTASALQVSTIGL